MIGLADCNNFFVSCERSVNPSLVGKAVVVLSNNDGCVVARSNEAKRLGIKMGQPAFEIKDLIRSGNVIALSGNHLLYRSISLKVHDIFRKYAPSTIDYSVDEAFLLMDGIPERELTRIGEAIHEGCMREAKIPVTIGFSTTKTLAKLVTEQCKAKGLQTDLCYDRDELYDLLQKLSIKELWGIGRRLTKKLYQCGVYTIADYYDRDKAWIRSNYGVTGERTWSELHGISCIELDHIDRRLQDSISETRTFPLDVDDIDYLRSRIAIYASECARRLRRMNGKTHKITVFLRGNPFRADGYREANTEASCIIERATNDSVVLVKCATELLRSIFNPNHRYKRGGVILNDIVPAESVLPSLFDYVEGNFSKDSDNLCSDYQRSNLMVAIDELNKIPGNPSIKLASLITQGQVGHNDGYSSSFQAPKK